MYEYTAPYCGAARRDSTVLYTDTAHAAVLWYGLLDSAVLRYCLLYSVVLSQVLLVRLVLRYGLCEFAVLFMNFDVHTDLSVSSATWLRTLVPAMALDSDTLHTP
jgi:hypothetical protein